MYKEIIKPILFKLNPEFVHEAALTLGEIYGTLPIGTKEPNLQELQQNIATIDFNLPVGLAAGFDYDAKLTQTLPKFGFGFGTVGTVTNLPYKGNPSPMLGRLPKSKALLVNKGFKSKGADSIISKLTDKAFAIPIGISIGRSNSAKLTTQEQSVDDICQAFSKFEASPVVHSYYELNISCPNLIHGNQKITFYDPNNLKQLLEAVTALKVTKPIFVKMPIILPDEDVLALLEVIKRFKLDGVIFGNLETNRANPLIVPEEANEFDKGNFSGKPTFERSNELIALTYRNFSGQLVIIGCGGIFSAQDAYTKIKCGANLVQLITGMIFEGPSLINNINAGLVELLIKDGFTNITQAVGKNAGYKLAHSVLEP